MRVMLDTNVLISMLFFPSKPFSMLLENIVKEHTLVLSSFVVDELMAVADRKFPLKKDVIDRFLSKLSYDLVYTPRKMQRGLFDIRDQNDYPIIYTAIMENIDVLISGDKDITEVNIDSPEILTPSAFITKYLSGEGTCS